MYVLMDEGAIQVQRPVEISILPPEISQQLAAMWTEEGLLGRHERHFPESDIKLDLWKAFRRLHPSGL